MTHIYKDFTYKGFTLSIRDSEGNSVPFNEIQLESCCPDILHPSYSEMIKEFKDTISTYLALKRAEKKKVLPEEQLNLDKLEWQRLFPSFNNGSDEDEDEEEVTDDDENCWIEYPSE